MRNIIIGLIVLTVIILFQNTEASSINILFWSIGAPKIVLWFLMLLLGGIIGAWSFKRFVSEESES